MLVSIIIPAFNPGVALLEAVRSALSQTWRDIEVIVVDDGSTDGSAAHLDAIADTRLRVVRRENQGSGAARNFGAHLSRGSWLKFLDADDLLDPEAVAHHLRLAEELGPRVASFGSMVHFMDGSPPEKGRLVEAQIPPGCESPLEFLLYSLGADGQRHIVGTTQWFLSRELFEAAGGWPLDALQMEDQEFLVRIASCAESVSACAEARSCYRRYPGAQSKGFRRNAEILRSRFFVIGRILHGLEALGPDPRIKRVASLHYRIVLARAFSIAPDVAEDCLAALAERGLSPEPLLHLDRFDRRWERLFGWRSALQTRSLRRRLRRWNPFAPTEPELRPGMLSGEGGI